MIRETPARRAQSQQPTLLHLDPADTGYPASLHRVPRQDTLPRVTAIGNVDILQQQTLALFCSVKCPGRLILQTYDLAQALREAGVVVIGGFHSPMEQECLRLLLRGKQPIVVCPARSIETLRLPVEWRPALATGRLLVLSPFDARLRRQTAELAQRRNRFVAALADEVFIAYAAPGSRSEAFAREMTVAGKPLLTLDAPENAALLALGARAVRPASFREQASKATQVPPSSPGMEPLPLFD